jgi:hypothetical protein
LEEKARVVTSAVIQKNSPHLFLPLKGVIFAAEITFDLDRDVVSSGL